MKINQTSAENQTKLGIPNYQHLSWGKKNCILNTVTALVGVLSMTLFIVLLFVLQFTSRFKELNEDRKKT